MVEEKVIVPTGWEVSGVKLTQAFLEIDSIAKKYIPYEEGLGRDCEVTEKKARGALPYYSCFPAEKQKAREIKSANEPFLRAVLRVTEKYDLTFETHYIGEGRHLVTKKDFV